FQAEDGIRVFHVTGVQTCALPISFTNPAIIGTSVSHNPEWAAEIIGERSNPVGLTWPEVYLLHLAKQAEPDPPPPPLATARRLEIGRATCRGRAELAGRRAGVVMK